MDSWEELSREGQEGPTVKFRDVLTLRKPVDWVHPEWLTTLRFWLYVGVYASCDKNSDESFSFPATLCEMEGNYVRAVELLVRMLSHPEALAPDVPLAKIALDRLRAKLSGDNFAAAYERGKDLDLEVVVAELLRGT